MVHVEADFEPHVGAPIVERIETAAKRLAVADKSDTPIQAHLADALPPVSHSPEPGASPNRNSSW
jgi:hypothetical protein